MPAALLALALSWASITTTAQAFEPARFIPLAMTVLRVEAPTLGGRLNIGTAITVAPGVVVTNCHVIRDATVVRVVKQAGQWPADGQFADTEHDLCFLSVPTWPGSPVRFAEPESIRLYQQVVAMGFTRGAQVSLTPGEITGLHAHDGGQIVQSSSSFNSGASGGALLDAQGRLIGVLTFRLRGDSGHYFSVPASWVAARLPIPADRYRPIEPLAGRRAFWEADGCCLPYFMRVGGLQAQAKWPELLRLAEDWIAADPDDADAWLARGVAQAHLRQPREAVAALERATTLAPRNAEAWFELGAAGIELGDDEAAGKAHEALTGIQSELAGRLAARMPQRLPQHRCQECGEPGR
jgi:serine protease Do